MELPSRDGEGAQGPTVRKVQKLPGGGLSHAWAALEDILSKLCLSSTIPTQYYFVSQAVGWHLKSIFLPQPSSAIQPALAKEMVVLKAVKGAALGA